MLGRSSYACIRWRLNTNGLFDVNSPQKFISILTLSCGILRYYKMLSVYLAGTCKVCELDMV